jgi:hypothetical protein
MLTAHRDASQFESANTSWKPASCAFWKLSTKKTAFNQPQALNLADLKRGLLTGHIGSLGSPQCGEEMDKHPYGGGDNVIIED